MDLGKGNVIVQPEDLWEVFTKNRQLLAKNYMLLAESREGFEIYLTEESGMPFFTVECEPDNERVAMSDSCGKENAEKNYTELLNLYVLDEEDVASKDEETVEDVFEPDDIDRLDELHGAVEDLVEVFLRFSQAEFDLEEEDIDDIGVAIGQYLMDTYGLSVRYPTIEVDDDSGLDVVIQFPFRET